MSKTLLSLAAATLMVAALATVPAMAQTAAAPAPAPAAAAPAHHHAMHHAAHHKASCYDYAWQSQAQQDCLAKGTAAKPAMKKTSHKAKKKMATPKTTS